MDYRGSVSGAHSIPQRRDRRAGGGPARYRQPPPDLFDGDRYSERCTNSNWINDGEEQATLRLHRMRCHLQQMGRPMLGMPGLEHTGGDGYRYYPGRRQRCRTQQPLGRRSRAGKTLAEVSTEETPRQPSGSSELDRVLGGGLVSGSVVLIGGDPGIGKSTILLQTLCQLARNMPALYVTGEESQQQVAMRAERLGLPRDQLKVMTETCIENIIATARREQPRVMVVDSIQTIFTEQLQSAPGGVAQVRESAALLVRFAKQSGTAIFLVGHVTKEGSLAGPRVLEHMVDTVLYFEGESDGRLRMLRAVKNRFGAVNELGVFAMTDKGLKEVANPSAIFLSRYDAPIPGSVVMSTWEGSRPMLVEVQALVDTSHLGNPRRVTLGLDQNRLAM